MSPSIVARDKLWFLEPWEVEQENRQNLAFEASIQPEPSNDGDAEVLGM